MPFSNAILAGTALVRTAIKSPLYVAGTQGWSINQDGTAEFNNVTIRGGTVVSGQALYYNGPPAAGSLIASISAAAGTDAFGNAYLSGFTSYSSDGSFVELWENGSAQVDFQPPSLPGHDFASAEVTALSFAQAVGNGQPSAELIINSPSDNNVPGGDTNSSISLSNGNGGTSSTVSIDGGVTLLDTTETQLNGGPLTSWGAVETHSIQTDSGTVASATYVGARTGTANVAGVAFIAPVTGKTQILWHCGMSNSAAAAFTLVSIEVRQGSVVGSGTLVLAATDNICLQSTGNTAEISHSSFYPLTGLTVGNAYNVRLMYRVTSGTGTLNRPRVQSVPILG